MTINREYKPAFSSGEFSPALAARIDLQKYDSAAKLLLNVRVRPEGGVTRAEGTRFLADTGLVGKVRLIPFSFSSDDSCVLEFTHNRLRILTSDGLVMDGNAAGSTPVSLVTPYTQADLPGLAYAQDADIVYLAHVHHPPHKLLRYSMTNWILQPMTFVPKTPAPTNLTATFSVESPPEPTRVWNYQLTAIDADTGEESLPASVSVIGTETLRIGALKSDGTAYVDWFASLAWAPVANADEYRVYKEKSAGSGVFGYIGSSIETSFADRNIAPNTEDTPPMEHNPFADGNNPACVTIHQQRLFFAGSALHPNTLWGSRSGQYENFTKSIKVKDDDYIEAKLASKQVNPIVWLAALRELIVGTTGNEWEISGAGGNKALTPGGLSARLQSARGSAKNLAPVIAGNVIMHVGRGGTELRDLQYAYNSDSYSGVDRSLFAGHLFENRKIIDLAYQQTPNSIIWCVMSDGLLLGLTWLAEQDLYAWTRQVTDGAYDAVCSIPGAQGDEVFFCVKRTVQGITRRYIEKLEHNFTVPDNYYELDNAEQQTVLSKAFYVHSGLSYRGEPVSVIHGLEHLEGRSVTALYDGAVHTPLVVTNGSITLRTAASVVHVGLPYSSVVETVNFEPARQDGSSIGKRKRIARMAIKMQDCCGLFLGVNGQTVETKWRSNEDYGRPPRMKRGTETFVVPGTWNADSSVTIKSDNPLPFTVLGIVPEVVE